MSDSISFYRDLLEFAPDAIIVIDREGRMVYANATAHSLFGYEPGTLFNAPIEQLIPEESRAKHVAHRNSYGADPRTREMGNRGMPLLGQRRDGSKFRAEIRLAPIRTPEGILSAAAVRDATESERIMSMMAEAKETADEANATKSRFLAAASHDLRQPLQTLHLLNGTLKRLTHEPAMLDVLEQEERALGTMSELLNALLNVTKLESGTVMPSLSDLSLEEIFEDLEHQFASPARLKNLDLRVEATTLTLHTDATLLRELIQNLLANAVRYTDIGRVVLRQRRDGDRYLVEVEDTGVGIPEAMQEKVFDDFFQAAAKGATHRGGVGLGLGIVRRLSKMLALPVAMISTVGTGTRFSIDVSSTVLENTKAPVKHQVDGAGTSRANGRRILLVEDEQAMRLALKTYLQLDDHHVELAGSLADVDELLRGMTAPPDIVISDFHLVGHERGSDAIERIRARFGSSVPAIILTGDTSLVPARFSDQPATRMLNKPVDVQILTATMKELLAAR